MNLYDDVVYRCLRLRPLRQLHPGFPAALSVTTIAFIVNLPMRGRSNDLWLLNRCRRRGAQKLIVRYKHLLLTSNGGVVLKPRCHWCWRDETRVGRPWTSGHAFRIPELASAEDQCARRGRIWLRTGKSSVGSQRRVCTSSRGLLSTFAVSRFLFCQAAGSVNAESP